MLSEPDDLLELELDNVLHFATQLNNPGLCRLNKRSCPYSHPTTICLLARRVFWQLDWLEMMLLRKR
jgi:hypothetical protein